MPNRKIHPDERRNSPRIAYRTTGIALSRVHAGDPNSLKAVRIWTENFGVGGALVISREPLQGTDVLVKLLLPHLGSTIVECTVAHSGVKEQQGPLSPVGAYWYGLRFGRKVSEESLPENVRACLNGNVVVSQTPSDPGFVIDPKSSTVGFKFQDNNSITATSIQLAAKTACEFRLPESLAPTLKDIDHPSSLMPILSAIGLVIVYASVLFA